MSYHVFGALACICDYKLEGVQRIGPTVNEKLFGLAESATIGPKKGKRGTCPNFPAAVFTIDDIGSNVTERDCHENKFLFLSHFVHNKLG